GMRRIVMRPQRIDRPGEIFERVAQMRHFPVEDRAYIAVGVVEKIAAAIISVHDADFLRRRRRIALQPADRGARDGLRLAFILLDHLFPALDFVFPTLVRRARAFEIAYAQRLRIGTGNAPKDGEELLPDLGAMCAIGIRREDRADKSILDLRHDEEWAFKCSVAEL